MTSPRRTKALWRGFGYLAAAGAIALLALPNPLDLSPVSGPADNSALRNHGTAQTLVPAQFLIGSWLTVIRTGDRPQPVRLKIHKVEIGETAGKMIYLAPKRCIVDLQYGGAQGSRHVFYLVPFTNCFEYGDEDYVALMGTAVMPPAYNDLSQQAPAYRRMPRQQTASAGESDAAPAERAGDREAAERLEYLVNLGGRDIERAFLTRE